jgi:membrane-bound lytic murein transglycosylase A
LRTYFETWFTPFKVSDGAGNEQGLLTGYYEPLLRGSRLKQVPYIHPVYAVPGDLVRIELGGLYPELAHHRLRGRLVGNKVVPYHGRAHIEAGQAPLAGQEILWVDDAIALFFLHIQGSGKVALDSGEALRLAYADQNGHPYRAIGKTLVERGALKKEEVSLQSIRAWLERNPESAAQVMQSNPSYVFFEEQPDSADGPKGAQGVALTAGHSIAVDPRSIPLGVPVYIESTWPQREAPFSRLAIAQDTGGAIRGAVRADLFLGAGTGAEETAGRMRQPLRAWVLLPKGWKD